MHSEFSANLFFWHTLTNTSFVQLRKGKDYVDQWMRENCCLIPLPESGDCNEVLALFMSFLERFRGAAGNVYLAKLNFFFKRFEFESCFANFGFKSLYSTLSNCSEDFLQAHHLRLGLHTESSKCHSGQHCFAGWHEYLSHGKLQHRSCANTNEPQANQRFDGVEA